MIVNRDEESRGPATSFALVAEAYAHGRPGYPDEATRWLVGESPRDVLDLGAGTGKLTRSLVSLGHRVTAVEPLTEMLELLPAAAPGAFAMLGSAEVIPLPDASADVVTAAGAFHWFDHAVALPEIARVLRPQGRLGVVWNTRDDREPWVAELSRTIGAETVARGDAEAPIEASGLFGTVEKTSFTWIQRLDGPTRLLEVSSEIGNLRGREIGGRRRPTRLEAAPATEPALDTTAPLAAALASSPSTPPRSRCCDDRLSSPG